MMDARFEDAPFSDQPLRLKAETADDLVVIASLVQDAVLKASDIHWMPRTRRLVMILHRFRWEDRDAAEQQNRAFERVQSALTINDALTLRVRGIDRSAPDSVQALLTLGFEAIEDGSGKMSVVLANNAEIAVDAECLSVTLSDLTQPWEAKASTPPTHPV